MSSCLPPVSPCIPHGEALIPSDAPAELPLKNGPNECLAPQLKKDGPRRPPAEGPRVLPVYDEGLEAVLPAPDQAQAATGSAVALEHLQGRNSRWGEDGRGTASPPEDLLKPALV